MPPVKTAPKVGPKATPKGTGLNTRIGGIPLWVIGGGLVVAIAVGLYFRSRSGANAATSAEPMIASEGSGGGGESSLPGADPGFLDLADAIWGLTGVIGAGGASGPSGGVTGSGAGAGGGGDAGTPAAVDDGTTAPVSEPTQPTRTSISPTGEIHGTGPQGPDTLSPEPISATGEPVGGRIGAAGAIPNRWLGSSEPVGGRIGPLGAVVPQWLGPQAIPPAGVNPANVVSVKRLASGATLTTLKSGRQITQAPGKKAYVTKK